MLHVDKDPQIQQTDIIVPAEGTPSQQKGESAEGTNFEQGIEWVAIPEREANGEMISILAKLCDLYEAPESQKNSQHSVH